MRGWGHLTGRGHGALGLDDKTAISIHEANAALIVRAVNSHDAFMEVLSRWLACAEEELSEFGLEDCEAEDLSPSLAAERRMHQFFAIRETRAALTAAKETAMTASTLEACTALDRQAPAIRN